MAELLTIARPYAEAAFAQADASGKLGAWSQSLQRLAAAAADPAMRGAIGNPNVSASQLYSLIAAAGGDEPAAEMQNFIRVLIDNDRLALLPEIHTLFETLKDEREGVVEANVASAFPIEDAALAQLVGDLERRFKRKVRPNVTIDASLIGGALVTVGDEVIDGSVHGRLAAMAAALRTA